MFHIHPLDERYEEWADSLPEMIIETDTFSPEDIAYMRENVPFDEDPAPVPIIGKDSETGHRH